MKLRFALAALVALAACNEQQVQQQAMQSPPAQTGSNMAAMPQSGSGMSTQRIDDPRRIERFQTPPTQPVAPGRATPMNGIHLMHTQIMDPTGFEKPMAASTILVPVGWKTEGGVVWNGTCNPGGYTFNWSASAPDGSMTANIFPGTNWMMDNLNLGVPSSMPGCPNVGAKNAQEYFMWLARTFRPQGRVLDYRNRPDMTKGLEQFNNTTPFMGGETKMWVEAGEVLIASNSNGQEMRETVASVVVFGLTRMQGVGQQIEFFSGSALPGYAFKAPNGQLNFKLAEAIRASIKSDPNWMARINKMTNANQRVALNETAKRSQIIAQTSREINEMSMAGYRSGDEATDRMRRADIETIRGVETYTDPQSTTGTVELTNLYNNAWRMQDGSYVLTDDPSFNPYVQLGQDGKQLQPAPP